MGRDARILAVALPLAAWCMVVWAPSVSPEGEAFAREALSARGDLGALASAHTAHLAWAGRWAAATSSTVRGLAALSLAGGAALLALTAGLAYRLGGGVAAAFAATALAFSAPFVVASGAVGPATWAAALVWATIALGTSERGGWWRAPGLYACAALALVSWPPTLFVGATLLLCALLARDERGGARMPLRLAATPAAALALGVAASPWWWPAPLEGARDLALGALETNPASVFMGEAVSGRLPWYAGALDLLWSAPAVALALAAFGAWGLERTSARAWAILCAPLCAALAVWVTGALTLHGVDAALVALPAVSILAGLGASRALAGQGGGALGVRIALAAALVLPAGWRIARSHPHADSATNALGGGRLASGMEAGRTRALPLATLDAVARAADGEPVYLGALGPLVEVSRGAMSRSIVAAADPTRADFVFERVVAGAPPATRPDGLELVAAFGPAESPTHALWGR